MAIVRWAPARHPYAAQSDLTRLFNSLFDSSTPAPAAAARRWSPATDLIEDEESYVLATDLPGLSRDDVKIELNDNVLTISGERKFEHDERKQGYRRIERSFGTFRRSLTLPDGVDPASISATFDNGVLTVTVPKPEQRKPQTIEIKAGSEPVAIES